MAWKFPSKHVLEAVHTQNIPQPRLSETLQSMQYVCNLVPPFWIVTCKAFTGSIVEHRCVRALLTPSMAGSSRMPISSVTKLCNVLAYHAKHLRYNSTYL